MDKLDEKSREILEARKQLMRGREVALGSLEGKGRDLMTCICEFLDLSTPNRPELMKTWIVKANVEAADKDKLNEEEILGQVV